VLCYNLQLGSETFTPGVPPTPPSSEFNIIYDLDINVKTKVHK